MRSHCSPGHLSRPRNIPNIGSNKGNQPAVLETVESKEPEPPLPLSAAEKPKEKPPALDQPPIPDSIIPLLSVYCMPRPIEKNNRRKLPSHLAKLSDKKHADCPNFADALSLITRRDDTID